MPDVELEKEFKPDKIEKKWYARWEEDKAFHARSPSAAPYYSIVIPPPNVTGELHMGHALNNTIQDVLCRYWRMRGKNVLWVPGTDHAGIATQNVVERNLAEEGLDRHALGRERFVERVWEWKKEYGGRIIHQLKRLGSSCDWDRERFTMDEGLSRAVLKVFVDLYNEGLIYRGERLINWCVRCMTALADLEVEQKDTPGNLWYIRYPLKDAAGHLTVATTRPETMLGDTGVAVNPGDSRFREYIGKTVILPLMNREIPVISDEHVDPEFGTGCLKITPGHDPYDFEIGLRHNLDLISVLDTTGRMNEAAGPYEGLDRYECRERVVEDLKALGLLEKIEDHDHRVGHCYRCNTTIELLSSLQWFVAVKPLAEKAMAAVKDGRTKIIPDTWEKSYFNWLENIEDWCISRQIWWGHRIPAWYCQGCEETIVDLSEPERCPKCGSTDLVQETDVLDTWFSSALWPFSTLGWPDETPDLKTFYPTSCLVTAFDILFFWVARMMMVGIHFMDDVPFDHVYIHALVRDEHGKKMSKSSGNVIDPLVIMDKYGTDAFRFTLVHLSTMGRDVLLAERIVEGFKRFVNKIWQAARFTFMHLDEKSTRRPFDGLDLDETDRWIISRTGQTARAVGESFETYHFDRAAKELYRFIWHEFCDWYLEMSKPALYEEDSERAAVKRQVLRNVLDAILRMLHPIMPFLTEELYMRLPGNEHEASIMKAPFPVPDDFPEDTVAQTDLDFVQAVIGGIRNIRGEMGISPSDTIDAVIICRDAGLRDVLESLRAHILGLARVSSLTITKDGDPPKGSASSVHRGAEVFVPLAGMVDFDREIKRLTKEMAKLENEVGRSKKKLDNPQFLKKAAAEAVAKEKDKYERLVKKLEKVRLNYRRIKSLSEGEMVDMGTE